jgi:hypothetical protein
MRTLFAATILAMSASVASAQVAERSIQLQFHDDGTVTLSARNASTSDILLAWARECDCFVVNGNRLTGPVSATPILFERAPQSVVLRSLLRQAGGYVLTPRRADAKGPSQYETIYILPTSAAVSSPVMGGVSPVAFQPVSSPTVGAPDDEIPPVTPIRIPEPIDPNGPNPSAEPAGPSPNAPTPGVSLPGVRVVPISPVGPTPSSPTPGTQPTAPGTAPGTQPTTPGSVTPAPRNP